MLALKESPVSPFSKMIRSGEVSKEVYYAVRLKQEDRVPLKKFVKSLGERLIHLEIPSSILTVGSSTFPLEHWEARARLNQDYDGIRLSTDYNDIDLRIAPCNERVETKRLMKNITSFLDSEAYRWERHDNTMGGTKAVKSNSGPCPYLRIHYGLNSISTKLRNGTPLDLIIGHEEEILPTSSEKIAEERKENFPFSILYSL
ncbi:MAG: hypothetical protein ABIJ58_01450 [Nanoarchaeota archaeon]